VVKETLCDPSIDFSTVTETETGHEAKDPASSVKTMMIMIVEIITILFLVSEFSDNFHIYSADIYIDRYSDSQF